MHQSFVNSACHTVVAVQKSGLAGHHPARGFDKRTALHLAALSNYGDGRI